MGKKTGPKKEFKKSDTNLKKLEEAFSIGCTDREACFYAGITVQTLWNWLQKDVKLAERFEALKEKPVLKARKTVYDNLHTPDTAKWYLERKRKNEFSTRSELEVEGELKQVISLSERAEELAKPFLHCETTGRNSNVGERLTPSRGVGKESVDQEDVTG